MSPGIPYPKFIKQVKKVFSEPELKENIGGNTLGFNDAGFFETDIVEKEIPAVYIIIVLPVQQVNDG